MARRPRTEPPREGASMSNREKIINAFLALLAERRFEEIGLNDIAARAGVSLADFRGEFASALGILAAHVKEVDRAVLAGGDADMTEEPPRERLFDVLMRRLETLEPHKAAIRSLLRSAAYNPPLALGLNQLGVRSMQWMLTAADIDAQGSTGMVRSQGLACLFASVLRTWVNDDDPGLARTMAELDRQLARGARWASFLNDLCRLSPTRFFGGGSRWRPRPREEGRGETPIPV